MSKKKKEQDSNTYYFGETEEFAVREYLKTEQQADKEKIFNDLLKEPLEKMIESIIKRYRLVRDDMSIEDQQHDTLSFLATKFDKFNPEEGKKAYSYYGTVCKHYLMNERNKLSKRQIKNITYDDISSDIEDSEKYSYVMQDNQHIETIEFIGILLEKIKDEVVTNVKLKANELKIGYALIDLLENWEKIILSDEKSNILARNKVLFEMREMTFLTSKEVRNALKKYKTLYDFLKKKVYH